MLCTTPRSARTYQARALLALALLASAGCSNDGTPRYSAGREPRPLSESEVAEIKNKARSPQEFRKMVRARSLGEPDDVAAKKPGGKRPRKNAR